MSLKKDFNTLTWVNVVANPSFGFIVSKGGGYTWAENSREYRLTLTNDPISDEAQEIIYIEDMDEAYKWAINPDASTSDEPWTVRHG